METGWLAPNAEFVECSKRDHLRKAEEIAIKLGIDYEGNNADEALLNAGWIRISFLTYLEHGFSFAFFTEPASESQKEFLHKFLDEHREMISEQGMKDLYWLGVVSKDETPKSFRDLFI